MGFLCCLWWMLAQFPELPRQFLVPCHHGMWMAPNDPALFDDAHDLVNLDAVFRQRQAEPFLVFV
jgi:hypothetical protein